VVREGVAFGGGRDRAELPDDRAGPKYLIMGDRIETHANPWGAMDEGSSPWDGKSIPIYGGLGEADDGFQMSLHARVRTTI